MKSKKTTLLFIAAFSLCVVFSANAQDFNQQNTAPQKAQTKFDFTNAPQVNVATVEELYAAVNNSANAGNQIVLAAGVYLLSATDSGGAARPNGGRLELQENMSLKGVVGDRGAVIIDAVNLPNASYAGTAPVTNTGAIRTGKGSNSVEWMTVRNAVNGGAGIIAHLSAPGAAYVRIAHIAATGHQRGIDVRNIGTGSYAIELEIVDNDLYSNRVANGQGLRIINSSGTSGNVISAALSGNRAYNNNFGVLVENIASVSSNISVFSSGDRFFDNGGGAFIGGGYGASGNGNTVSFTAVGSSFENNNSTNNLARGGLIALGAESTTTANSMLNNTVNVSLRNCRLANNQEGDLKLYGARSNPVSVGNPGTNNRVTVKLFGTPVVNPFIAETIPENPSAMNSAVIIRSPVTPSFDYDGDGRADLSVFRPTNGFWYLNRNQGGFDAAQFGLATDRLAPADYDGDGRTDIAVYRAGTWYLRRSQTGLLGFAFGSAEDIPQPADFDGDGRAEIAVWRPSNGVWYVFNLATNQFSSFQLGASADKPAVGDYDGDGLADYAVFRPSNGTWLIQRSTAGFISIPFGISTDKIVPADYDGDGKTDVAVFRPTDGNWYIRQSASNNVQVVSWGLATDALIPADYDGDGKSDVAVFRNGIWYVRQSSGGINTSFFGSSGDVPTNQLQ